MTVKKSSRFTGAISLGGVHNNYLDKGIPTDTLKVLYLFF